MSDLYVENENEEMANENSVLAVTLENKMLGMSYLIINENRLVVLEDVKTIDLVDAGANNDTVQIVKGLISELRVDKVIVPTKVELDLMNELEKDAQRLVYSLMVRASHEFTYITAKRLVDELFQIGNIIANNNNTHSCKPGCTVKVSNQMVDDGEIELFVESFIGGNNGKSSINAMGGLLLYLQREFGLELLINIEFSSLKDTMLVSMETLRSLRVFNSESHPNKLTNTNKEGLSVYGILNFTSTRLGAKLLESWLMRPSTCIETIKRRQDTVGLLIDSSKLKEIQKALRKVKDIYLTLGNMNSGKTSLNDWKNIVQFLTAINELRIVLPEIEMKQVLDDEENSTVDTVNGLHELLSQVIDFEMSEIEKRIIVQPQADPDLDEMKKTFANIEEILKIKANELDIPEEEKEYISVIYFPQLGYLISSASEYQDSNWTLSFTSSDHAYFKNEDMIVMDEEYGDLFGMICDREIEIVQLIQQQVLTHASLLQKLAHFCAELDCCCSLAQASLAYSYVKPIITTNNVIEINEGRHPLYELLSTFMPNDTRANGDSHHPIVIMTGANFSGKSVYLTQVALIVLMAHVGSFVPAEYAKIGITDKILARVTTGESVSKTQSAFMIDLQQISTIFKTMTCRSLVIIDEFGKGTNGIDGAALFGAAVQYFLEQPPDKSPKVFASTHFHELFEQGVLTNDRLSINHMEVEFIGGNNELTYLYGMRPGKASSSFGVCCAAMCGVPESIVHRADYIIDKLQYGNLTALIVPSEDEQREIEQSSMLAREFLKLDTTDIYKVLEFSKLVSSMNIYNNK